MTDYEQLKLEINENEHIEEITIHSDGEECKLVAFHFGHEDIKSVGFDIYDSEGKLITSFGVDLGEGQKVADFFQKHLAEQE